jgi:hypothetical protein
MSRYGHRIADKEAIMTTAMRITHMLTIVTLAMVVGVSADAGITVLDTDFSATGPLATDTNDFTLTDEGPGNRDGIYSYTYNAGAASDMLVVSVSTEASGEAWTNYYDGVPMIQAVQSSGGSGVSIWYLANPSASGTIAVDLRAKGTVNGFGLGIASLSVADGTIELHSVGSDSPTNSVDITTTVADTFVMVAGDANAAGAPVSMDAPLTTIGTSLDVGSSQAGCGYTNAVPADSHTYSWTPKASERGIAAAAFVHTVQSGTLYMVR